MTEPNEPTVDNQADTPKIENAQPETAQPIPDQSEQAQSEQAPIEAAQTETPQPAAPQPASPPAASTPDAPKPASKPSIKIGSQRDDDNPSKAKAATPVERFAAAEAAEIAASAEASSATSTETSLDQAAKPTDEKNEGTSFPPPRIQRVSADLQKEIDDALGDVSLDDLMSGTSSTQSASSTEIELDSRYQGTVVKVHRDSIFFSLGANHEGIASTKQFDEIPEVGTQMEVVPFKFLADEGLFELGVPGGSVSVADWSDLQEGVVVEVLITGSNKGGLECEVNKIRGFMPAGQVSLFRIDDFEQFIGQKLLSVVTEANPDRRNLVVSHRAVLEREKQELKEKTLAELEVGQTREGTVTKLMDFGAFVDIGGVDGLLHISQLSWDRINHPSEVLEAGQGLKVRIEKIQDGRISLAYRDMLTNPWDMAERNYATGTIVKGTVSKIMEFGAFVKLEPGIEGLVHISELAHHRVFRVTNVVNVGDEVEVKVLSIDRNDQKISLSIKAAQAAAPDLSKVEEPTELDDAPRESIVKGDNKPLKGGLGKSSGGEAFGLNW